jgi:hypothetical protein
LPHSAHVGRQRIRRSRSIKYCIATNPSQTRMAAVSAKVMLRGLPPDTTDESVRALVTQAVAASALLSAAPRAPAVLYIEPGKTR